MKNLNCIIVDDEPLAIEVLVKYVGKISFLSLSNTFVSPLESMAFLHENKVDLIFLDINMPDLSGIQLSKIIRATGKPMIIFTTAYHEYAVESYEHDAIDYLVKPIEFDRFLQACRKALERNASDNETKQSNKSSNVDDKLIIKSGTDLTVVWLSEILFIEGTGNYVTYHCKDQKVMSLQNLSSLAQELPNSQFIRVHKSFIVSLFHIKAMEGNQIKIHDSFIPIGRTYRTDFLEKFVQ